MRTMVIGMGQMWHDGAIRLPEPRSQWPSLTNLHYHRVVIEEGCGVFLLHRKP